MPTVSVIMPIYNVERFVGEAVRSVLAQSCGDFELLIIDDCSPDDSVAICEAFDDSRIRIIRHSENRGLAGARNTGIRAANGDYLAFLDSDDVWHPEKLAVHVAHLEDHPEVGVSFSRSAFIDEQSQQMGVYQMPRLTHISPAHLLCRNPVGNGSAPVIRQQTMQSISFSVERNGHAERCYFDENFRRSEDIECWVRIALFSPWRIAGLAQPLTYYRLNAGGLSANLFQQLSSWEQMITKIRNTAPEFLAPHEARARAFQLRYLARQAIRLQDGKAALQLLTMALRSDWRISLTEPGRTGMTAGAAALLYCLPLPLYQRLEAAAQPLLGAAQRLIIHRQLAAVAN